MKDKKDFFLLSYFAVQFLFHFAASTNKRNDQNPINLRCHLCCIKANLNNLKFSFLFLYLAKVKTGATCGRDSRFKIASLFSMVPILNQDKNHLQLKTLPEAKAQSYCCQKVKYPSSHVSLNVQIRSKSETLLWSVSPKTSSEWKKIQVGGQHSETSPAGGNKNDLRLYSLQSGVISCTPSHWLVHSSYDSKNPSSVLCCL